MPEYVGWAQILITTEIFSLCAKKETTCELQSQQHKVMCTLLSNCCLFMLIDIITEAFSNFLFTHFEPEKWSLKIHRPMCNSANSYHGCDLAEGALM